MLILSKRFEKWGWIAILVLLSFAFFLVLLPKIRTGTLWHNDEILSANRVREMIVRNDPFTVTRNFEIDCKKPPLQYWFSALILNHWPASPEFSIRVVSTVYGALAIFLTGILGWLVLPKKEGKTLGLFAALGVIGCGYFIHMARLGLLDCGAAFHLTAVVLGCQLVINFKDNRWWWFVGLQAALGALQKVPYGLFAWIIILAVRFVLYRIGNKKGEDSFNPPLFSWHLVGALLLTVVAVGLWPAIQWWRFGGEPLNLAFHAQSHRLTLKNYPALSHFHGFVYWYWLTRDWAMLGLIAPIAVGIVLLKEIWCLITNKRVSNRVIFECVCILSIAMVSLSLMPFRVQRYLVSLTPLFSIVVIYWALYAQSWFQCRQSKRIFVCVLLLSCVPVAFIHYTLKPPAQHDLLLVTQAMKSHLTGNEKIVINPKEDPSFNIAQFALFYAKINHPIYLLNHSKFIEFYKTENANHLQNLNNNPTPTQNWIGICKEDFLLELSEKTGKEIEIISKSGTWICWRMSG